MSDAASTSWLQLSLEAVEHSAEQLEDALLAAGALVVTLQDAADEPVLEPPLGETPIWSRTCVTGLFDAQTDVEVIKEKLRRNLNVDDLPECRLAPLEERDWVRAWLDDYHPMRFGERLWVCPTWQAPPESPAINVLLDPGLAFGTGAHPTTALCLEWLDGAELRDKTVIDYGCGSGILAIAAAKLGASQVWAVDIDPQALLACRENATLNQVTEQVVVLAPEALTVEPTDMLLANILAGPLMVLAPYFARLVRPGGKLALAGLLQRQSDEVRQAFAEWFKFAPPRSREDWALLEGTRHTA